jgi:hypothetical protein
MHLRKYKMFWISLTMILILGLPGGTHAQGCSLCRDATAGSAPHARQGLRRGIFILGLPAGLIFAGILLLARRIPPRDPDEGTSSS